MSTLGTSAAGCIARVISAHALKLPRRSSSLTGLTGRKVFASAADAVADIRSGTTLLVGGFGLCGVPESLIRAVRDGGARELTVVSATIGTGERGLGLLFQTKQVANKMR